MRTGCSTRPIAWPIALVCVSPLIDAGTVLVDVRPDAVNLRLRLNFSRLNPNRRKVNNHASSDLFPDRRDRRSVFVIKSDVPRFSR